MHQWTRGYVLYTDLAIAMTSIVRLKSAEGEQATRSRDVYAATGLSILTLNLCATFEAKPFDLHPDPALDVSVGVIVNEDFLSPESIRL